MTPSRDLRERVLAAARNAPAPSRAALAKKNVVAVAIGLLPAAILLARGSELRGRPLAYVVVVAAGWALVALAATWGALGRGRSMVGRPSAWLVGVALATPVLLLASAYLGYVGWPSVADADCARLTDLRCFGLTIAMAMGPLLAFAYARRGTDPVHPALTGAAIGASAGAWAGVAIAVHCPYSSPLHVAAGHVLPTALAAALGLLVGAKLVAVRGR